jgi:8-oxo-dGTP diphosphatase
VKEETGYDARITGFAGCVAYEIKRKQKVVLFWTMEPVGNCFFEPSQEVKEIKWMDVSGALEILNYPKERELLMLLFGR